MRKSKILGIVILGCYLLPCQILHAQNSYPSSGNALINGLTIGKFGRSLSGDSDPYNIYSPANTGDHDLILFGDSGEATLNLRLYDGDLKLGSSASPEVIIYNSGTAYFNGKVGIGTTTPTKKLTVNGAVKAKEVIITEDMGADFVFNDNYPLLPLEKLEQMIQKEHHLPGIPSAEQMKREGVRVGNLQMKLLQKIEELTLYMIDMNEKIKKLQQQNVILKRELQILKD